MTVASDVVLAHYGVKGMKWGVRKRDDTPKAPASDDARQAAEFKARVKTSTTASLSNKELQALVTRMNLERQYSQLAGSSEKNKGAEIAKTILRNTGTKELAQLASGNPVPAAIKYAPEIGKGLKKLRAAKHNKRYPTDNKLDDLLDPYTNND